MPAAAAAVTELPPLTLRDEVGRIAPGWDLAELCRWPPDAFAFTATVLADSGAYRCVVSPPPGCVWPPPAAAEASWEADLRSDAAAWADLAGEPDLRVPESVRSLAAELDLGMPLLLLDRPEGWSALVSLLRLHALADEACAGAGMDVDTAFGKRAAALLREGNSLSRLPVDRLRILPKLRPPSSGMTLRSLSHHVALDRSEVEAKWVLAPPRQHAAGPERLTLLLIPHPAAIRAADFVPVQGPLANMDLSRYGFYEYQPEERFDSERALRLVDRACRAAGRVDVVVLPEGALEENEVAPLQKALSAAGVPYLIAGVRQSAGKSKDGLGGNYAHFGAAEFEAPPQHKHHRWCLDTAQVHQYHLGSALDPDRQWWEAIGLPRRSLTFISVMNRLAICPLVCEDLARPDPVTDVIRSVAPTLVVGLLLDGPQLAERWPARYASVLADDPGCSVLTLTALGMTKRSLPPGHPPSRAIALWKDPRRGLQEILLAEDAEAVALTAHVRSTHAHTADGRVGSAVAELVLSGIEQIA